MIQLWLFPLDLSIPPDYQNLLTEEELGRYRSFRNPPHGHRFQLGRTILRLLLARQLNRSPQQIEFAYSPQGKPYLQDSYGSYPTIDFNLSHSGQYGLIGINPSGAIGVDLEMVNRPRSFLPMARRFFAHQELQLLQQQPEQKQRQIFYQLWTAKEAWLKATGLGISGHLTQVVVDIKARGYQHLPSPYQPNQWQWRSGYGGPDYRWTVAAGVAQWTELTPMPTWFTFA